MRPLSAALLAAAALPLVAAAPAKPTAPARTAPANYAAMVTRTPQGGLLVGNPNAPVKLVEFGSLTCSHCRDFHAAGFAALKARYIPSGRVAYEFRSFARNGPDFAGTLLVACFQPREALAFVDELFRDQDAWLASFIALTEAENQANAALPVEKQFARLAAVGKLDARAVARGLTPARVQQCLAAKPVMDQIVANRSQAVQVFGLTGTPTFVLNGKTVADTYDWAKLQPALDAALKP